MKPQGPLRLTALIAGQLALAATARSQSLTVEEYEPRSTLVVAEHPVPRSRFPFVDVHAHIRGPFTAEAAARRVAEMDALNLAVMVNLSGGSGAELGEMVRSLAGRHPGRFVVFANLDFKQIDEPDWGARAAAQLERDVRTHGAVGLKIFKNLGLDLKDGRGRRVRTDDPRFDPVWRKAGELGIPVLIHTGEPIAFFDPHDRFNERWLELKQFPNRARPAGRYPPWDSVMTEQHRVFRRHPSTVFISAHMGWMANDLGRLARLLDSLPNVLVEVAAVIHELGRQPRAAHEFFVRYQDRVLLGKDTYAPEEYPTYFRLFETADEYFPYFRKRHAFWRLYGLQLPDSVLRKLYAENAARVIPGVAEALANGR
jgi:predicted TIM-barrel fold metal-dependent hydrolase